jgi:hypothetical protein
VEISQDINDQLTYACYLFISAVFFIGGWQSTEEALVTTKEWGTQKRKWLDQLLGVKERLDEDHPEVVARKKMTPEEEREYLTKKYSAPKIAPHEDSQPEEQVSNRFVP